MTAGIPTAAGFVNVIRDEHKLAYERATAKTYPQCMAELLLAERRYAIRSGTGFEELKRLVPTQ